MYFEISKELLAAKISDANSIVEKNSPTTILTHIYLKAENDLLTMIATDTELSLRIFVPAKVMESGTITVPSDSFTQLVNRLPDGSQVQCSLENEQFLIKAGRANFKLQTLPADDFPVANDLVVEKEISLDAGDLTHILSKVRFSMAENDPRHYLNGLYIYPNNNNQQVEAVSTDGHRLSVSSCPMDSQNAQNFASGFILPSKAVNALIKQISLDNLIHELNLRKQASTDIDSLNALNDQIDKFSKLKKLPLQKQKQEFPRKLTLMLSNREFSLNNESWILTSRLLEGKYPDYEKIIPNRQNLPILIERNIFIDALRRSQVILNKKEERGLMMHFEGNKLSISARNANSNDSGEEQIDIINNQDINCDIGINVLYLYEAVSNLDGEYIQIHIQNSSQPILITSQDDENVNYVIMPMRL